MQSTSGVIALLLHIVASLLFGLELYSYPSGGHLVVGIIIIIIIIIIIFR